MSASRKRSLVKTLSWRVIATVGTVVLVYIFTGELALSLGIGSVDVISKTIMYYLHERAWNRIHFGKLPRTYETETLLKR